MTTLPETSSLPDLLTVEEAAALLRIGRTKAYAMSREWRATNGQRGLPVVDFGSVLRVPRAALEEMVGAALVGPAPVAVVPAAPATPAGTDVPPAVTQPPVSATPARAPRRAPRVDQLDLFDRTAS